LGNLSNWSALALTAGAPSACSNSGARQHPRGRFGSLVLVNTWAKNMRKICAGESFWEVPARNLSGVSFRGLRLQLRNSGQSHHACLPLAFPIFCPPTKPDSGGFVAFDVYSKSWRHDKVHH
jgi:hypothetical protein